MKISEPGLADLASHEGFVSKTYRCPAGVLTIGYGFTMGSRVFAAWCRAKYGRGLRLGDRITKAEALELLPRVFDEEYGAAVNRKIAPTLQHHYDSAGSMTFNCGPGALNWTWAKLLKAKRVPEAADRLRVTAVTANGRRLNGLVRRRKAEAAMMELGRYGHRTEASVSKLTEDIMQYQKQLKALGYDLGVVDGVPGRRTKAAVRAFQLDHDLVADGIFGPATRAALIRALDGKRTEQAAKSAPVASGGGATALEAADLPTDQMLSTDLLFTALTWGGAALALVLIVSFVIRFRGAVTGRRVPT